MSAPRFFTDEDIYGAVAIALRRAGIDAISTPGIIVSRQRPVGDLLRRLINLAGTRTADARRDRLEFLGDW